MVDASFLKYARLVVTAGAQIRSYGSSGNLKNQQEFAILHILIQKYFKILGRDYYYTAIYICDC